MKHGMKQPIIKPGTLIQSHRSRLPDYQVGSILEVIDPGYPFTRVINCHTGRDCWINLYTGQGVHWDLYTEN